MYDNTHENMYKEICESSNILNSLNKTYQLCKTHKVGCSKRQIKRWADAGIIVAIRDGHKYLINWQSLYDYIHGSKITEDQHKTSRAKKQLSDLAGSAASSVSRRNTQIEINRKKKK